MGYTTITIYCDRCKEDSEFSVRRRKGYNDPPANKYCNACNEEIYYQEIEKENEEYEYEVERQEYLDDNSIESAFGDYSGDIYNRMYD